MSTEEATTDQLAAWPDIDWPTPSLDLRPLEGFAPLCDAVTAGLVSTDPAPYVAVGRDILRELSRWAGFLEGRLGFEARVNSTSYTLVEEIAGATSFAYAMSTILDETDPTPTDELGLGRHATY